MKKQWFIFSFVLMISFAVIYLVGADNVDTIYAESDEELYSIVKIHVPRYPVAINDAGEIVGTIEADSDIYCIDAVHTCLYHYKNDDLIILNGPGGEYNYVADINDSGEIIGMTSWVHSGSDVAGFIYDEDNYYLFSVFDAYYTWLNGINNFSEIVGYYRGIDYHDFHSFIRDKNGEITILSDSWEVTDINDKGDIIFKEGYLLSGEILYEIDSINNLWGINNTGEIISYNAELLRRDGSVIHINVPESVSTYSHDINNLGEILLFAKYKVAGNDHYFIAKPILARLVDQIGNVKINHNPAEINHPVHARDHVEVGDKSLAKFKMLIDNKMQEMVNLYLGSNTEIKHSDLSTTYDHTLEFFKGKLRSVVDELPEGTSFEILTPVAQCATKGTDWVIEGDENHTIVTVLEGSVDVSSLDGEQSVTLEENNALQATSEGLGEPYDIDPDKIDDWWNSEPQDEKIYLPLITH